jgi:hypothetical protein
MRRLRGEQDKDEPVTATRVPLARNVPPGPAPARWSCDAELAVADRQVFTAAEDARECPEGARARAWSLPPSPMTIHRLGTHRAVVQTLDRGHRRRIEVVASREA